MSFPRHIIIKMVYANQHGDVHDRRASRGLVNVRQLHQRHHLPHLPHLLVLHAGLNHDPHYNGVRKVGPIIVSLKWNFFEFS